MKYHYFILEYQNKRVYISKNINFVTEKLTKILY